MLAASPGEDKHVGFVGQGLEPIGTDLVGVGVYDPVGMQRLQDLHGTPCGGFIEAVDRDPVGCLVGRLRLLVG